MKEPRELNGKVELHLHEDSWNRYCIKCPLCEDSLFIEVIDHAPDWKGLADELAMTLEFYKNGWIQRPSANKHGIIIEKWTNLRVREDHGQRAEQALEKYHKAKGET